MSSRPRGQAAHDEIPVEICYALVSAAFLGAVVFGVIAGPVAVWELPSAVDRFLVTAGAWLGGALAVLRVIHVLWRHRQGQRL